MLVTNFKLKYFVYKVICGVFQVIDLAVMHPMRERARAALRETVDYIGAKMPDALGLETQREVLEYSLKETKVPGHYLEFGVFTGGTIRFIAKRMRSNDIHGFDSFEGLPQNWSGFSLRKSALGTGGRLPKVPSNVHLHRGWFDQTLPGWLEKNEGPVAFLHIDCDIYSSTKIILNLLASRLQPGTIVVFDEYFNYPNWQEHEFKAFREFVNEFQVSYEYIAFARQQAAVRLVSLGKAAG